MPAAFRSRMGPGLMSGTTAVRTAPFFIRRGFRYIPVTYTGIALLNYFKFLMLKGPPKQDKETRRQGDKESVRHEDLESTRR